MILLKNNPKGIDIPIQRVQKLIYSRLKAIWGITDNDWNCYGRCYRNKDEQGKYLPEAYTGQQGKEYTDVLYSDKVLCTSFFGESDKTKQLVGGLQQSEVHLIFCINAKQVKNILQHRGDSEIHNDVLTVIGQNGGVSDVNVQQWFDSVFREYTSNKVKLAMLSDTHPAHCFRINFTTTFSPNACDYQFASSFRPEPPIVEFTGFDNVLDFALN